MNNNRTFALTDFIYAALFAAVTAVLGWIAIPLPFSPVPVTGQSLAIMLAGSILTPRQAALSITIFLMIGLAGVPVFAGGTSGFGVLAGPRGGYLIGWLVGAVTIALLKGQSPSVRRLAAANLIGGIVIIYTTGVLWLNAVTGVGLQKALMMGALPFIPGDLFKVCIAVPTAMAINRQRSFKRVTA